MDRLVKNSRSKKPFKKEIINNPTEKTELFTNTNNLNKFIIIINNYKEEEILIIY